VCVYASEQSVEKCKLEGHLLDITHAYEASVPWQTVDRGERMVNVRSSLYVQPYLLGMPPQTGRPGFAGFTRAVRVRIGGDLELLPVRDPSSHFVERRHVTVYTDEAAQQVLVVYAPTAAAFASPCPPDFEFVVFTLT
jgi:hypothetical protein